MTQAKTAVKSQKEERAFYFEIFMCWFLEKRQEWLNFARKSY